MPKNIRAFVLCTLADSRTMLAERSLAPPLEQEHMQSSARQQWLVRRSEGTAGIMDMMKLAVKKLDSSPPSLQWSKVACHTSYRLAQYADSLYRSTLAQKHSPEWATSQRVIRHKRQQVWKRA